MRVRVAVYIYRFESRPAGLIPPAPVIRMSADFYHHTAPYAGGVERLKLFAHLSIISGKARCNT